MVLEEEKLNSQTLLESLRKLYENRLAYIGAMNKSAQSDAIGIICGLIEECTRG